MSKTSLITNPEDLKIKKIFKGLIYGQPGVGKTTLALSSPIPLCLDIEQGMIRVDSRFRCPSLQVDTYDQVLELVNSNEINPFETIVIDTLGKLIDKICDYVAKKNPKLRQSDGQMSPKGWGNVKTVFNAFINLLNSKNKSWLFVAHESEEKNGDETIKRPDCAGSSRKDLVKELDFMGYMEVIGSKSTICFAPSSKFYAKNSLGLVDCIEIPVLAKDGIAKNDFISRTIVKLTQEKITENESLKAKYQQLIDSLFAEIDAIQKPDEANAFFQKLKETEEIWSSKLFAKNRLVTKTKELGMTFDKESGLFVIAAQKEAA